MPSRENAMMFWLHFGGRDDLRPEESGMWRPLLSIVFLCALLAGIAYSQQEESNEAPDDDSARLYIGQPLADLKSLLSERKIKFHEGGFELGGLDPDVSFLSVTLDHNHTYGCVFYSKSRMEVTKLVMVFFPSRRHTKTYESWIGATEISLFDDGSYAVHFAPPISEEELRRFEAIERKSERPQSGRKPRKPSDE